MPKTPDLPWWYQPDAIGSNSMDRPVDIGFPIVPQQIEIRDGGIFWSFDPEHELLRIDPRSDSGSQFLGHTKNVFTLKRQRTSMANNISESDALSVMAFMKYDRSRSSPGRRALTDFLKLQEKTGVEAALEYAKVHGVLDICEHWISPRTPPLVRSERVAFRGLDIAGCWAKKRAPFCSGSPNLIRSQGRSTLLRSR